MQIIHDRSYISEESKELIDRGFAAEELHCLRLSFIYTEEERAANQRFFASHSSEDRERKRLQSAKMRSDVVYEVVQAIAEKYVCYQFDPECKAPYDSDGWDLFFWCNSFCNTEPASGLQGNDYSYLTLSFNHKHDAAKQQTICDGVLAFIEREFPDHPNLHLAIQYGVRVNEKKVEDVVKQILPSMLNRPCTYHGKGGKVIQTSEGIFFRRKRARKYGYRLDELDILRLFFLQNNNNCLLTPYTTPLYNIRRKGVSR